MRRSGQVKALSGGRNIRGKANRGEARQTNISMSTGCLGRCRSPSGSNLESPSPVDTRVTSNTQIAKIHVGPSAHRVHVSARSYSRSMIRTRRPRRVSLVGLSELTLTTVGNICMNFHGLPRETVSFTRDRERDAELVWWSRRARARVPGSSRGKVGGT